MDSPDSPDSQDSPELPGPLEHPGSPELPDLLAAPEQAEQPVPSVLPDSLKQAGPAAPPSPPAQPWSTQRQSHQSPFQAQAQYSPGSFYSSGPRILPFGEWPSPITAAALAESVSSVGEIVVAGEQLWWSEQHPSLGRTLLMCLPEAGDAFEATPPQANVRTRVHEYGGAAWWVADGICVYSDDSDGHLRKLTVGQTVNGSTGLPQAPQLLTGIEGTHQHRHRWADFRFTADGRWLIGVRERHDIPGDLPANEIAAVALDGSKWSATLVSGTDFYASPRISPDGRWLAWLSWNLPDMPWDGTQLWVAELDLTGVVPQVRQPRLLAGNSGQEWLSQPEWHHNKLYYVSERGVSDGQLSEADTASDDGAGADLDIPQPEVWSAIWVCEFSSSQTGAAAPRCLLQQHNSEIQMPPWVFGESRYALTGDGPVWAAGTPTGDKLCFGAGVSHQGCSQVTNIAAWQDGVVALAARWDSASEITYFARRGSQVATEVIRPASGPSYDPGFFPEPEALNFAGTHALYFAPAHPEVKAPVGAKPPLVVLAHGGPTSQARKELSWNRRFWTSRGFAVVDVNYRGSTGFGRRYRDALKGSWGVADVQDCAAAASYLCERGDVDPDRLAIIGSSAGGYSVLCALSFTDVFAAGVSRYGIADLEVLAQDTHKFESRYLDSLVGPYPQTQELYRQRSPIHHTKGLSCPMLIMQGELDKVVPPAQAELMVKALAQQQLPYAYLTFPDEGHGFRNAHSQVRAREAELSFFGQIFGFVPADAAEPGFAHVEIVGQQYQQ